jgi:5-methylcytosine-specific restriction enzyme A
MAEDIWSTEELRASVATYAEMYRADHEGRKVNKAQMYRDLEARFGRGNKAFSRRMQNISHVVKILGGEPVRGLVPLANVGTNTYPVLEALVFEEGFLVGKTAIQPPTTYATDPVQLDTTVEKLLGEWESSGSDVKPPAGLSTPMQKESTSTVYERSPEVKAWVLRQSGYVCECCGKDAPFKKKDGTPFLEVHHVVTLANGGPDTVANAVAICPDCHRALHYSGEKDSLVEGLYQSVDRLERH